MSWERTVHSSHWDHSDHDTVTWSSLQFPAVSEYSLKSPSDLSCCCKRQLYPTSAFAFPILGESNFFSLASGAFKFYDHAFGPSLFLLFLCEFYFSEESFLRLFQAKYSTDTSYISHSFWSTRSTLPGMFKNEICLFHHWGTLVVDNHPGIS